MSVRRTVDLEDGDHAVACDSATISFEGDRVAGFYLVASSSLSLPAILAGVLDTPLGLKPTLIFGTVIAALALGVGLQAGAPPQARRVTPGRPVPAFDRACA